MSTAIFTSSFSGAVGRLRRGERRVAAPSVLVMEEVHKSYGAGARGCSAVVRVLDGASLRVGAGEIVGVAGGEGAGKSTLLLCAAGMVRPERGRVLWVQGDEHEGAHQFVPRYLDLRGGMGRREIEDALAAGARLILVDHAAPALFPELRAMFARTQASAIVVASRDGAALARVASRVLMLCEGRLHAFVSGAAARAMPVAAQRPVAARRPVAHRQPGASHQRNRSAARASSSFPAALARARMRST